MNKTKKELFEENKKLKKDMELINDWIYGDNITMDNLKKLYSQANKFIKLAWFTTIVILGISFFILGVVWNG